MIEPLNYLTHQLTFLGGPSMSCQTLLPDRRPPPVPVWARLGPKDQAQVIQLMAQLAFKLVVAQPNSPLQEVNDAIVTQYTQNPG